MSGLPELPEPQTSVGIMAGGHYATACPTASYFTCEQMREYARTAVKQAKPSAELLSIGTQMANVFFNWAQESHFTAHQRGMMTALQKKWDELARSAAPAAEVAGGGE